MEDYFDSDMLIVIGVSAMDLLFNFTCTIFGIIRFYLDFTKDTNGWLCVLSGTVFFNSSESAFDLLVSLTIMRHLVIVNELTIPSWVWLTVLFGIGLLTWIPSLVFLSYMEFEPSSSELFCNYSERSLPSSLLAKVNHLKMLLGFVILIGCLISMTFKYNRDVNNSMLASLNDPGDSNIEETLIRSEYNKLKRTINLKLVGMILAFTISFLPQIIMNMIRLVTGYSDSNWEETIIVFLDSLATITSPIFVFYINEKTFQTLKYLNYRLMFNIRTIFKNIKQKLAY
jgi:hypothetical protein